MKFLARWATLIVPFFCCFYSSGQTAHSGVFLSTTGMSILESTTNSTNLKTLMEIIRATDLEKNMDGEGPFTLFAPSDEAFKKFSKEKIAYLLLPENKRELFSLMAYHIVAGNFTGAKILKALSQGKGQAVFTTVQGTEIKLSLVGVDIILTDTLGNSAKIIKADAAQTNGVIHEIDTVILPKKI